MHSPPHDLSNLVSRRAATLVLATGLLVAVPAPGEGFDPSPGYATLESYHRAVGVLEKALEANGGRDRILAIRDVSADISGAFKNNGRGLRPELVGPDDTFAGRFVLDFDDDWLFLERDELSATGVHSGIRTTLRGESGERTLYPDAQTAELGAAAVARIKSLMAGRLPLLILRDAWQDRTGLRDLGEAAYAGRRHHLLLVHRAGLPTTLFVDAETYRVSKTEHLVANAVFGDSVDEVEFSDYRTVDGVLIPFRRFHRHHGLPSRDVTYGEVLINRDPTLPTDVEEPPGKLENVLPAAAYPIVEEVAPKVYYVRLNRVYSVLVVAFDDRLLMVDAPTDGDTMEGALAAIRAEAGDLPVSHVVLTHHHFDHLSGLRPLLAEGAAVVAEAVSRAIVEAMAERPRTLAPDRYAREPRPLRFEELSGRRMDLGDGGRPVEVYAVGPTEESEDMLIVYLPGPKLLFQADLLTLLDGRDGLAPANRKNLQLAAAIEELELDVERLFCSHGGEADLGEFLAVVSRGRETAAAAR